MTIRSFRRLAGWLTAVAVAAGIAFYASHGSSLPPKHTSYTSYTTSEILEYLLLSKGKVVTDHPALARQNFGAATKVSDARAQNALEAMTRCIDHIDASAAPKLTAAFNAADPHLLDSALRRFDGAARQWLSSSYKQDAPCPPPPPPPSAPADPGSGWADDDAYYSNEFVFVMADMLDGAFTGAVLAVIAAGVLTIFMVAIYLAFVLVPVVIWYQFESAPSELDRQTEIAKIVQALRS
jgi:hypothetical protein